jgi:hypothetical protein
MPSLERVNAPAEMFPYNDWPLVTLMDLAYEEYVARDRDGAATAHVERYWAHLAQLERDPRR